jgi:hypothetical protein
MQLLMNPVLFCVVPCPFSLPQEKAIPANCPTRFGVKVEIAQAVLDSKDAIRAACFTDSFAELREDCASAETFFCIAVGPHANRWWKRLAAVVELLQPVRDAIHQLEGDQAMMSQVLPVWRKLGKHFAAWHSKHQQDAGFKADQVVQVLQERKAKVLHDAALVSFAFDPFNFKRDSNDDSKWLTPTSTFTMAEDKRAKTLMVRLLGGSKLEGKEKQALSDAVASEWSKFRNRALEGELASDLLYHIEKKLVGGKVVITPLVERVRWWDKGAEIYPKCAIVARMVLPRQVTTCAAERNWSTWGLVFTKLRNRLALDRAGKLIFIAGNKGCLKERNPDHQVVMQLLEEAAE